MTVRFFRVGGCVRDEMLGVKSKDIDFAVEAPDFETMAAAVEARCSKVFLTTPEFFTIRGLDPEFGPVDFVLCRVDGPSSDGRRPDWVRAGTIFDDLARRDFTINAMARDEDGVLIDPHGGAKDLQARLLRFVGEPEDRLAEDALRAFRLMRFAITKWLDMDPSSKEAVRAMTHNQFEGVSTDRIRVELFKCFTFDTEITLRALMNWFPNLLRLALDRGIWLRPTVEDR